MVIYAKFRKNISRLWIENVVIQSPILQVKAPLDKDLLLSRHQEMHPMVGKRVTFDGLSFHWKGGLMLHSSKRQYLFCF